MKASEGLKGRIVRGGRTISTLRINSTLLLVVVVVQSCSGPTRSSKAVSAGPPVRVCVAEAARSIVIGVQAGAVIETDARKYSMADSGSLACTLTDAGELEARAGRTDLEKTSRIRCYYREAGRYFVLAGRRYPDTLLIVRDSRGFVVLNIIPMETYVRGVVPNELGRNRHADEIEAIKAQAILARTYALLKTELPLARTFDLYADTRDQVYTGLTGRSPEIDLAVRQTAGLAVAYGGKFAECYYHSTCGGATEAVSLVWNRPQSKPYLSGIRDAGRHGDYCTASPSYRWTEKWSRRELEQLLMTYLPALTDSLPSAAPSRSGWHLLDLRVVKRMPSGRVAKLNIALGNRSRQYVFTLGGDRIRWILRRPDGNSPLRSSLFSVEIMRDGSRWISSVTLRGAGNGHGIGMCQWGALDRAKKGYSAGEIIEAYFPGVTVAAAY